MSEYESEFMTLHDELIVELGADGEQKLNRLILLERAANQRHWANKLVKVVKEMREEADRYDPPRKT